MNIVEEVERRRLNIETDEPKEAYEELKSILEDRMKFSKVKETKYFNDVEGKDLRAKIETMFGMDKYTIEVYEIFFHIDKEIPEVDIQIKAKLVTNYPETKNYQNTLWYYAYRSLFDKFLYGSVREGYEHAVEDRLEQLVDELRETMEDDYNG